MQTLSKSLIIFNHKFTCLCRCSLLLFSLLFPFLPLNAPIRENLQPPHHLKHSQIFTFLWKFKANIHPRFTILKKSYGKDSLSFQFSWNFVSRRFINLVMYPFTVLHTLHCDCLLITFWHWFDVDSLFSHNCSSLIHCSGIFICWRFTFQSILYIKDSMSYRCKMKTWLEVDFGPKIHWWVD